MILSRSESNRRWRQANSDYLKARRMGIRTLKSQYLSEVKRSPCVDCGFVFIKEP